MIHDLDALMESMEQVLTDDVQDLVLAVTYEDGSSASTSTTLMRWPDQMRDQLREVLAEMDDMAVMQ